MENRNVARFLTFRVPDNAVPRRSINYEVSTGTVGDREKAKK